MRRYKLTTYRLPQTLQDKQKADADGFVRQESIVEAECAATALDDPLARGFCGRTVTTIRDHVHFAHSQRNMVGTRGAKAALIMDDGTPFDSVAYIASLTAG